MNNKELEHFLYWVEERHRIHRKKLCNFPKPWTEDVILQDYFFTNPYRENDKVTDWFRLNVRDPMRNRNEVLMATIIFRWFNYIPTGQLLLKHDLLRRWDCKKAVRTLKKIEGQVFTGAFNISASGSTKPKVNRVCEDYIQPMWEDRYILLEQINENSLEEAHRHLRGYIGMGGSGFMAYEVICDLRFTFLLRKATDILTWSNPGPGALRGMNRLMRRDLKDRTAKKNWIQESQALLDVCRSSLPRSMPKFEMREVEHSLCEFDKYRRAMLGDGHMKRRYKGAVQC